MGSQKQSSTTTSVIHKPVSLGNFHMARIWACQSATTTVSTRVRPSVPNAASRIMPASARWRPVASARAVCWANTICSGMFGTHMATASITPKAPYSATEIFLLSKWTR
jgi:hypothetical protein